MKQKSPKRGDPVTLKDDNYGPTYFFVRQRKGLAYLVPAYDSLADLVTVPMRRLELKEPMK